MSMPGMPAAFFQGVLSGGVHHVDRRPLEPAVNVFSCQIDDALSGLDRSPGYVRRDDSVGRIEKRIVRAWRFCRQHIRSKTGKFAAADGKQDDQPLVRGTISQGTSSDTAYSPFIRDSSFWAAVLPTLEEAWCREVRGIGPISVR